MSFETGIDYVDATYNPWQGCTKVSRGCLNCYMYTDKERFGQDPETVVRSAPTTFRLPLAKRRDGSWKIPDGSRVMVCSWSDFFATEADPWRTEAYHIMLERPGLTWVIPTKRPQRIFYTYPRKWPWRNIIILASVEDQANADRRVPELLLSVRHVDAKGLPILGLSVEPMLGPVDLEATPAGQALGPCGECGHTDSNPECEACIGIPSLGWVICGSESGSKRRPFEMQWARDLKDQCVDAGIPFFLKQAEVDGKLVKMPELDGRTWGQIPGGEGVRGNEP